MFDSDFNETDHKRNSNVSYQLKILLLVLLIFFLLKTGSDGLWQSVPEVRELKWNTFVWETHFKMNSLLIHDYVFIKISKWNAEVRGSSMTHIMQEEGELSFERISIFRFMNSTNSNGMKLIFVLLKCNLSTLQRIFNCN